MTNYQKIRYEEKNLEFVLRVGQVHSLTDENCGQKVIQNQIDISE